MSGQGDGAWAIVTGNGILLQDTVRRKKTDCIKGYMAASEPRSRHTWVQVKRWSGCQCVRVERVTAWKAVGS